MTAITATRRSGDLSWMEDALCAQTDPEAFHPDKGAHGTSAAAKRTCAACDVTTACLAYALADPSLEGVWGGTSVRERQAMRRKARR